MAGHSVGIEKRLLRHLSIISSGCWLWTGSVNEKGYGYFRLNNRTELVHRASYSFFKNIPMNELGFVLHKVECNNHNCFNPDHLYVGTHIQNMHDKKITGTHHNSLKKYCPSGHEYSRENTRIYRGYRYCKECARIRQDALVRG